MLNKLILGDNLEVLKSLPDESVDLIYIDPPFFSNRNYAVIWGDKGEIRSFEDCWNGGVDTYINWMYKRVLELHRVLKSTGSMYLHCDWHADAYLRVYVMDKIFGMENFRNEITWQRTSAHNDARKKMPNLSDKIYYYSKSKNYTYNPAFSELSEKYKTDFYRFQDEKGMFRKDNLTGPKANPNDPEWRGYLPSTRGRSWSISKDAVRSLVSEEKAKQMSTLEKLDLLYDNNLIDISGNGVPSFKRYLENSKGVLIGDIWTDINNISPHAKEKIGYPTQKPEALLERIIKASSNQGDVVLDCFVGGGTTIAVAQRLGRHWIGIDQSPSAFGVSRERILKHSTELFPIVFEERTAKWDYDVLRNMDDFDFEKLVVKAIGGELSKARKGVDMGIDGIINGNCVISVKRSENIGRNVGDNLRSAILRYRRDKSVSKVTDLIEFKLQHGEVVNLGHYDGFIIAFSFGAGLKKELAVLEREEGFRILPLEVKDILPVASKPNVVLRVECIKLGDAGDYKFIATATTSDNRIIEFFAFKIMTKNKIGELEMLTGDNFNKLGIFEAELMKGEYQIIATATDEYGLCGSDEAMVVVR